MRQPLSLFLFSLFCALVFIAGCNPPSNPTCSPYIGQATINEVSKVQANATNSNSLDDANDFVEVKITNTAITAATLNDWNLLICERGTSNCYGGALSSATITTATDGSGARYYVVKSATNVARYINFAVGTEIALSDQNDYAVDFLSIGGYADHRPNCTFSYDTDATSTTTTRRIRRNADGIGNWETVTANDQPATEGLHNTAMPPLVAEWRMEQASWNGTSNEVAATTGTLHGTARNGAFTSNTTPSPARGTTTGSCRYGEVDGVNDYITMADGAGINFTSAMTFSAWIYPETVGGSGQGTVLAKGILSGGSTPDFSYALRLNNTNQLNFYWCSTSSCSSQNFLAGVSATSLVNTWTHVAVTFHSGYQKIYFNGVEVGASSTVGTLTTNSRPLFLGSTPTAANNPSTFLYQFDGMIDELRFYRGALTQAQVQLVRDEIHACGPPVVDHFSVAPASNTVITCEADSVNVTLTPHTADDATLTTYTGTVTLGARIGGTLRGSWELVTGTAGNFSSTGTGTATYTFASGQTQAVFRYRNTTLGDASFTATDGSASASENSNVTFAEAGFIFLVNGTTAATNPVPTQIAGKASNTGWNATPLSIRAVTTNPATGVCMNRLPAGAQSVEFAYDCVNPANCGASPSFTVAGSSTATIPASPSTPTTWQSVNLQFDSNATAPFVTNYSDAGQVQLYVRKSLTSDSLGPATTLAGNAAINVRPFGIRFDTITGNAETDETGTTATTADRFVAAGASFPMTLTAFAFAAGEDANNDGIPDVGATVSDNARAGNFDASAQLTVSAFTPSAGTRGTLGITSPSFAAGSINISQTYSEVGSMTMRVAVASYLGLDVTALIATSAKVGRFFPYDFALSDVTLSQSCTGFNYMSQPRSASYLLVARNVAGDPLRNYSAALNYRSPAIVSFVAENNNDGAGWDNRVTATAGIWDAGSYRLDAVPPIAAAPPATYVGQISFDRPSSGLDGPYASLQLGMVVTDKDGARLAERDMLHSEVGTCSATTCTAKMMGPPALHRYGRLVLRDTVGSDRASTIVVPALVEYFNGSQFVLHDADNCTQYGSSQINDVNFSGELASRYTDLRDTIGQNTAGRWWLPTTNQTVLNGQFRNYPNGLKVTPVAGYTGKLVVSLYAAPPPATPTVPAWLQYKWDGSTETGPSCTLTLGEARGHDRVIFWRERH